MAETKITLYQHDDSNTSFERRLAVEAALEIIRADRLGGGHANVNLGGHMKNLSEFADLIQAALKPKV